MVQGDRLDSQASRICYLVSKSSTYTVFGDEASDPVDKSGRSSSEQARTAHRNMPQTQYTTAVGPSTESPEMKVKFSCSEYPTSLSAWIRGYMPKSDFAGYTAANVSHSPGD